MQASSFFFSLGMRKCLERVNDRLFWNPRVFRYALIPRCHPNSRVVFFPIVTSIVYGVHSIYTEFGEVKVQNRLAHSRRRNACYI